MIRYAIILAGGEGSRLRPVTLEIPKPLVPVQGLPILTWQARWFARHGVEHITVTAPKKWANAFETWAATIRDSRYAIRVDILVEPEPMGTLGALAHHLVSEMGDDPVFVSNGDELKGLDLDALSAFHQAHRPAATVALIRVPNPSDYGVAEMEGHRIRRFHEKPEIPPSTLVSSGLYAIDPVVLSEIDRTKAFLMFEKDLFPRLAAEGRLGGCALDGPWYDCGTMERWEKAIREWREPA
ncbi:nucleotidyltransferase family protein [Candidatus Uhrbacteria bacterium]|nr:MAG: nucleotidyltransferase family protein [Candidatus Uhrbacteria bacterium]